MTPLAKKVPDPWSNLKFRPEKPEIISISLTLALLDLKKPPDLISLAICHDEDGWCQIPINSFLLEVKAE